MFPNPATQQVTIETKLEESSNLTEKPLMNGIRLVNAFGSVVYQTFEAKNSHTIQLGAVSPGIYTLQSMVDGIPISEIIHVKLN